MSCLCSESCPAFASPCIAVKWNRGYFVHRSSAEMYVTAKILSQGTSSPVVAVLTVVATNKSITVLSFQHPIAPLGGLLESDVQIAVV